MKNQNGASPPPAPPAAEQLMWPLILILVFCALWSVQRTGDTTAPRILAYSEVKALIGQGRVTAATLEENAIDVTLGDATQKSSERVRAVTPHQFDPELLPLLEREGGMVTAQKPAEPSVLVWLLPWLLFLVSYVWISRKMMGGGLSGGLPGGIGDFIGGRSAKPTKPTRKITFGDVAGQDMAKREVSELVDFLRDPDRFRRVGATVPHGVLMMGTVRTLAIQPDERHRLAVHKAGHAAAAFCSPGADPLYKVTIIPRGHSLGCTHMLPVNERHTRPEAYLRVQLTTLLAGRVARKLFLGSVSAGADDGIRRATALARSMVSRWGMNPDIGPSTAADCTARG